MKKQDIRCQDQTREWPPQNEIKQNKTKPTHLTLQASDRLNGCESPAVVFRSGSIGFVTADAANAIRQAVICGLPGGSQRSESTS